MTNHGGAAGADDARADVRVVAKGGAIQITGQLMQGGLSLVFMAMAVRVLGTTDYGLFRQVVQTLAIAGQVGLLGFNYSAMRFIARARATGDPGGVRGTSQRRASPRSLGFGFSGAH